jgi:hypothetical protein
MIYWNQSLATSVSTSVLESNHNKPNNNKTYKKPPQISDIQGFEFQLGFFLFCDATCLFGTNLYLICTFM